MNISLFYFSGTGNTWWVGNTFKKIAESKSHKVDLYNIEKLDKEMIDVAIQNIDVLGIAYPIYGSDIPKIMKTFLEVLLKRIQVSEFNIRPKILVLTSMLIFSGDGGHLPKKYFKTIGLEIKWIKNIALTSNLSVPGFRANPVSKEKLTRRMNKAKIDLENLLGKIESGKSYLKIQWGLFGRFLGWIQRVFDEVTMNTILKYSIDTDRCIKCLKCVKECPTENIIHDEIQEQITFGNKCTWCMRCYNRCPTQAILVRGRYCDPGKYKRLKAISSEFKIN